MNYSHINMDYFKYQIIRIFIYVLPVVSSINVVHNLDTSLKLPRYKLLQYDWQYAATFIACASTMSFNLLRSSMGFQETLYGYMFCLKAFYSNTLVQFKL